MPRPYLEDDWLASAAQDTFPVEALDDDIFEEDEFELLVEEMPVVIEMMPARGGQQMMVFFAVVGVLMLFLVGAAVKGGGVVSAVAAQEPGETGSSTATSSIGSRQPAAPSPNTEPAAKPSPTFPQSSDPTSIIVPYSSYVLTQGPHGFSYGHMAIDLMAGNGETIMSPIDGVVTDYYVDEYLNTVLVIENGVYRITMLHGNYTVRVDDVVRQGQSVGTESNNGYTMDSSGNLCYGRDCGYHTHLNIFNKQLGENVNPLEVLGIR